jgi:hypothetical protein
MTQTLNSTVQHAMVVAHRQVVGGWQPVKHYFTVQPVEDARNEFGSTLADAIQFVNGVGCTECGTEASETRENAAFPMRCQTCNAPGCGCSLTEDPHCEDVFFCFDCAPSCGCRDCMD